MTEEDRAVAAFLGEFDAIGDWLKNRRAALIADLIALERERDERAMLRRRARRQAVSRLSFAREEDRRAA